MSGDDERPRPRLLVATTNPGKLKEFAVALGDAGVDVVGLDHVVDMTPVEETGTTFEENARLKAEAFSLRTELPVLADDSGIEVDALNGAPGVHSARFGGPGLDDPGRVQHLLKRMREVPNDKRTGRFRCVLALARDGRTLATYDGRVDGVITRVPRGEHGFGYDPVFFHRGVGCTTAEISAAEKQRLSHRGRAIRLLLEALELGTIEL